VTASSYEEQAAVVQDALSARGEVDEAHEAYRQSLNKLT
jgi:hypothetical protein